MSISFDYEHSCAISEIKYLLLSYFRPSNGPLFYAGTVIRCSTVYSNFALKTWRKKQAVNQASSVFILNRKKLVIIKLEKLESLHTHVYLWNVK